VRERRTSTPGASLSIVLGELARRVAEDRRAGGALGDRRERSPCTESRSRGFSTDAACAACSVLCARP